MLPRPATPGEAPFIAVAERTGAIYRRKNSVEENKSLNILIKTLNEQMQVMRYEIENLKTKKNHSGGKATFQTHRIFYGHKRTSERN
jgi:hypothetical protein